MIGARGLAVAACVVACIAFGAATPPGHAESSQFKGLAAASRELSNRIAPKDAPLELGRYLPGDDLCELLGTWSSFGTEHSFRNGAPNSLNMVVWHATLSRFAKEMGDSCAAPRMALHPRFLATLGKICAWPAAAAKAEPVLQEFWLSLMGYNAPESEFAAWRDFFLASYARRPAAETVAAMTLAITMNPYFLLHK
jgi:hypothetical protein